MRDVIIVFMVFLSAHLVKFRVMKIHLKLGRIGFHPRNRDGCATSLNFRHFLLVTFWIIVACGSTAFSALHAEDDVLAIARQVKPSIVSVLAYDKDGDLLNQANGVFCNGDGDVITNVHALNGAAGARIKTSYGKTFTVTGILAVDKEGDLARLSVDVPPRLVYPLAFCAAIPDSGERVMLISFSTEADPRICDGSVSDVCDVPAFGTIIRISTPPSPDYGCAPLVSLKGEVFGLAVYPPVDVQPANLAIHGKRIERLLEKRNTTIPAPVEDGIREWTSSAEGLCNRGIFSLAAGNPLAALRFFEDAGKKSPGYTEAYFYTGYCKDKLGRYQEAIEPYKRAARSNPDFPDAHVRLGAVYEKLGCTAEAANAYRQVTRIQPEDAETHYKLGVAYTALGLHADALKAFQQVIRIKPDIPGAYSSLGQACYTLGNYRDAVDACRHAVSANPLDANAYGMMGAAHSRQGCYTDAIDALKRASSINPGNAVFYGELGDARGKLGQYEEAIEDYRQAISLQPGDAELYCKLGSAYRRLERHEEALAAYRKASGFRKNDAGIYRIAGDLNLTLKRYSEAAASYRQAIAIDPDDAPTHCHLALAYGLLNLRTEEVEAYKEAVRLKPDLAEAHLGLGILYANHGDKKLALEEYKTLQNLDRDSANALFNLIFK